MRRREAWTREDAAPAADEVRYAPAAREVSNWRSEATESLNPKPVAILAALFGLGRPIVGRCVRLNNYWCIKSAKWNGEIGTDPEGHVGFASAEEGAAAAAVLLRRYYLDFGRKSALDVVRRWAPAECGLYTGIGGLTLAVRGIGGTVRAKYLAAHRVQLTATPSRKGAVRTRLPGDPDRPHEDAVLPCPGHRGGHGRDEAVGAVASQIDGPCLKADGLDEAGCRHQGRRCRSGTRQGGRDGEFLHAGRTAAAQLRRPHGRRPRCSGRATT